MTFLVALLVVFVLSLLAGSYLGPLGWMDQPGGRRDHEHPVPRTGGVALVLTYSAGVILGAFPSPFSPFEHTMLLSIAVLGAVDDKISIRARWKALATLAIAIGLAWQSANSLFAAQTPLHILGGIPIPVHWGTYFFLLIFAYWSIPQGFNLIDGANGLALGYAILVVCMFWLGGHPYPYLLGILFGCFLLNWPKAFHFLGDCGSLTLGTALALLTFKDLGVHNPNAFLWIFAYPALDVSMVVLIRKLNHTPLGSGDRNHLHHQLQDRFPRLRHYVAPFLWFIAGCCASGAVMSQTSRLFATSACTFLLFMVSSLALLNWPKEKRLSSRDEDVQEATIQSNTTAMLP